MRERADEASTRGEGDRSDLAGLVPPLAPPGMIRGDPCIPRAWQELLAIIRLARVLRGVLPAHWRYGLHSELLQAVAMGGQR